MAAMVSVSSAERVVFPEVGVTKGQVVEYAHRMAERLLVHVAERPLSIRRYPRGLAGPGFFQKNVPAHYPADIARVPVPRSREASRRHRDPDARASDVTVYPVLSAPEHLPYVANQGAIELHVPTARTADLLRPDRLVIDLDPPAGAPVALVREAAEVVRGELARRGLGATVPVATGSKGYHVVARVADGLPPDALWTGLQQLAALLEAAHPTLLTTAFRVAHRGDRVFVDWLRNAPLATVIAPFSLRARPRATVAVPLGWDELPEVPPDGFSIADVEQLVARADPLAALETVSLQPFLARVEEEFLRAGLVLERFDRFRSR